MFTVLQTTDDYIDVCLRYAEARGWHKLAVITTTDASGQDFDATLDRVMAKLQTRLVAALRDRHAEVEGAAS